MFFAEGVSRSFGGLDVLTNISFIIGDGERVGLVGPNGAGKSTLLKLLGVEDEPDKGSAGHRGGAIGFLRQEAGLDAGRTLIEELWTAFPEARAVDHRLHDVAAHLERGQGDLDALIEEQGELFHRFDALDGYRIPARIGRVIRGLGFSPEDETKRCGEFSGGWQMRIALAKVLGRRAENVLLDEPTNHLDTASQAWLAQELAEYRGTVLMVTHDGEFLDRVATRILDPREGGIDIYAGNYSENQRQKAGR